MKNRNKALLRLATLLCTAILLCSCVQTQPAPQVKQQENKVEEPAPRESAFITIDINPSIELVVDEKHKVTSIGAANTDAEVMLWGEENIVGSDLDVALAKIATLAVEMGYLTEENADISITVTTKSGETEEALLASVQSSLNTNIQEAGIDARIEEAVDLVLSKELERVLRENEGKPGYDATLTLSRYRLVKSALQADRELTMDEAVRMSNDKLTETVTTAQKDAAAKYGAAYELATDEAQFAYDNAKQTLLDSVYTAIYTARRDLTSLLANYGAAYAGYRLAYRTIEHYAATMEQLIENPIFTSDDVFALAHALGVDTSVEADYDAFKEAITDENGQVTKDSVNAYINRLYKNMDPEEREQLAQKYDSVLEILDRLGLEASIIRDDGMTVIKGAMFGLGLSVSVETYEDIPALLEAIQKKIDDIYARMEADMTENEKEEVRDLQEKMSAKIAEHEKTYKDSLAKAKAEAEANMAAAKEEKAKENALRQEAKKAENQEEQESKQSEKQEKQESKQSDKQEKQESKQNEKQEKQESKQNKKDAKG